MFPSVEVAHTARASYRRLALQPVSFLHHQQGCAVAYPMACLQRQSHTYTTQVKNQDMPKNETSRYLDRLKDDEIAFQNVPEYVHGDFWKTEPGKGLQYDHADNSRVSPTPLSSF